MAFALNLQRSNDILPGGESSLVECEFGASWRYGFHLRLPLGGHFLQRQLRPGEIQKPGALREQVQTKPTGREHSTTRGVRAVAHCVPRSIGAQRGNWQHISITHLHSCDDSYGSAFC